MTRSLFPTSLWRPPFEANLVQGAEDSGFYRLFCDSVFVGKFVRGNLIDLILGRPSEMERQFLLGGSLFHTGSNCRSASVRNVAVHPLFEGLSHTLSKLCFSLQSQVPPGRIHLPKIFASGIE